MTTLVSVQSTQFVTIATAPVPSASVLQQSTETVSVRSDDGVTVVESPSPALTVKSEANSVLLNIETTSTVVLSVNTGALPPPDINRRIGEDLAAQVNGVTSTFTTAVDFVHASPGDSVAVFVNGNRQRFGASNDYTVSESGGSGTGFDTISLVFTPIS